MPIEATVYYITGQANIAPYYVAIPNMSTKKISFK